MHDVGQSHMGQKRRFIPIGFGTQVATTCQLSSRLSRPRKRSFEVRRGKVVSFEPLGSNIYVRRGLPFRKADEILQEASTTTILVDIHAEATSEKRALALYLDGRVSAVLGTHTHVATADEDILDKGTAFITDVGMTGGHAGVIGMRKESVISRFLTSMPARFDACNEDLRLNGVCLDIDALTGNALSIRRISEKVDEKNDELATNS